MEETLNSHNSRIVIDESVGSGGAYTINGHNNQLVIKRVDVDEVVINGHNNVVSGTLKTEMIGRLTVTGHNNVIKNMHVESIEVAGHNNTMKSLQLYSAPKNAGHNNKFSGCAQSENDHEDEHEQQYEGQGFENMGFNIQCQIEDMMSGLNLGGDFMDFKNFNFKSSPHNIYVNHYENYEEYTDETDSSEDSEDSEDDEDEETDRDEEEKYYDEQEDPDDESHISPNDRVNIINSIDSYAYHKKKKDEEMCAVCISKLENKEQVKSLGCKHVFHSKCINSWLKHKLVCPCCKAKVTIN